MKILWMSWRDPLHPLSGGAEIIQDEMTKRLVKDGHEVIVLTSIYGDAKHDEVLGGRRYIRGGNRFTVYWYAYNYYRKNLRGWADVVIDEVNTVPFFAKLYVRERHVALFHQLAREIWFYELPRLIGWVGYLLEPLYVRMLSGQAAITVSGSTKNDLVRYGFCADDVHIISEGLQVTPVAGLQNAKKFTEPTVLAHGSIRSMKRTLDIIRAFEIAKKTVPNLRLNLSGGAPGNYGKKVLRYIKKSPYHESIVYWGRTSDEQKINLMQQSHVILVASVREGWGLIVTEANSQGTPAIAYNVPGFRDSVKNGITGELCKPNPESMAVSIAKLLQDPSYYSLLQKNAYDWSKTITLDQSYQDFEIAIGVKT